VRLRCDGSLLEFAGEKSKWTKGACISLNLASNSMSLLYLCRHN
jgi:hypothetical protein